MLDTQKLVGLLEQLGTAVHKRVTDAEQKAEAAAQKFTAHIEKSVAAVPSASEFDAKVKAALDTLFPSVDLSSLESIVKTVSSGPVAQAGEAALTTVTGIDVPGIVSAITTATGVAADIVEAATQAHASAISSGASTTAAISASKDAAANTGAPDSTAKALSSVIATTIQVAKSTSAPVAQVAAAAVAHDDQTDENNIALPGADPVASAYHAAVDHGADQSAASTIANAVAAVAPTTVAT